MTSSSLDVNLWNRGDTFDFVLTLSPRIFFGFHSFHNLLYRREGHMKKSFYQSQRY
jgi:hypothetical protein